MLSSPAGAPPVDAHGQSAYRGALRDILARSRPADPGQREPEYERRQERTRVLLAALGDPQLTYPLVHIAGTNGKGTTAALISGAMTAAGSRVGLFTSPHLHTMRERIRLDMQPIAEATFTEVHRRARAAAEGVERAGYGSVSTLEMLTAMALLHFAAVDASLVVVEAFVGGRDDITNVVSPAVSVITNISLDHVGALGPSLAAIAAAKAGIIKPGIPVVVGPQPPEALDVLRAAAVRCQAPLRRVRAARLARSTAEENRAVARITLRELARQGHRTPPSRLARAAWERLPWPARGEWFHRNGVHILVDGAHCPWALRRLVAELRRHKGRWGRVLIVFGGQRGHDAIANAVELLPLAPACLFVAASRHPRAVPREELAEILRGSPPLVGSLAPPHDTVAASLAAAIETADPGNLVVATGSIAVAAEAREHLLPELAVDPPA